MEKLFALTSNYQTQCFDMRVLCKDHLQALTPEVRDAMYPECTNSDLMITCGNWYGGGLILPSNEPEYVFYLITARGELKVKPTDIISFSDYYITLNPEVTKDHIWSLYGKQPNAVPPQGNRLFAYYASREGLYLNMRVAEVYGMTFNRNGGLATGLLRLGSHMEASRLISASELYLTDTQCKAYGVE